MSDTGAADRGRPVPVLYVLGYGRSGSTVLDTVLGGHRSVVSVGELTNLVDAGYRDRQFCACGRPGDECELWSAVREGWLRRCADAGLDGPEGGGDDPLDRYLALQRRFEPWRRWPATARAASRAVRAGLDGSGLDGRGLGDGGDFAEYARRTAALFAALREASGRPVVVDSSKLPTRALALSAMPGIELSVVHLVRDGRGVVCSQRRAYAKDVRRGIQREFHPRPTWRTAAMWIAVNLLSGRLVRRLGERAIRVRYEDFTTDPAGELERIGALVGMRYDEVAAALTAGEGIAVGHCIAGNRLRMGGPVRLRLDERWKEELPPSHQRLFWLLSGWLARRYGYPRRPAGGWR